MKQTDLEKLLADMSLKEKVDQMLQLSGAFYLGDENSQTSKTALCHSQLFRKQLLQVKNPKTDFP